MFSRLKPAAMRARFVLRALAALVLFRAPRIARALAALDRLPLPLCGAPGFVAAPATKAFGVFDVGN